MPSGSSNCISIRPRAPLLAPARPDSDRGQPGVLGVNIADLDPDHHRAPGRRVEENARSPAFGVVNAVLVVRS
jgi:hypothetical protein